MANRFWVGGTATWDGTAGTKWSTLTGGASGAAAPTAADDVFFDGSSGVGTVTASAASVARSVNFSGFTGTFSHPSATNIPVGDATAGASNIALKLVNTMTYTKGNPTTSAWSFVSTSATAQSIDCTNAVNMGNTTFSGVGGSWQLVAAMTTTGAAVITLTNGTFNTNGQTCSWGQLAMGVGTKTLTLGASVITLTGTGTVWSNSSVNTTFNAGTSAITATGASIVVAGAGLTFFNLSITGTGSSSITGVNTFNNLTRSLANGVTGAISMPSATTVNGVFTGTAGNTASTMGRLTITPSILTAATASPSVITVNGSYSFTNVDFNWVTAAGSAALPWTGTSIGDGTGNTNITFDASRTLYMISASTAVDFATLAKWSLSSGGASASTAPLPQDDINIDANSSVGAACGFSCALRCMGRNINFTGIANAATAFFSAGGFAHYITGSLTLATGMSFKNSATTSITFASGAQNATLTTNSVSFVATDNPTFNINLSFGSTTGSTTIAGTVTTNGTLIHQGGTLSAGSSNITGTTFSSSTTVTRTINMGSGIWTLTGAGIVLLLTVTTGLTYNTQTSTIIVSDTSASGKTISGAGITHNAFQFTGGNTGTIVFNNSMTITTLTVNAPNVISFLAGGTYNLTNITATGSAGNVITITSTTPGSAATLSKSSGIVSADWLSLKDSTATGGAYWAAGDNSTSVSGNTGWVFGAAAFSLPLSDSVTTTDTNSNATTLNKADSATSSDNAASTSGFTRSFSDSVTITDAVNKQIVANKTDTTTETDAIVKKPVKNFSDAATIADNFSKVLTIIRSLSDSAVPSEAITKQAVKRLADSTTPSDSAVGTATPVIIQEVDFTLNSQGGFSPTLHGNSQITLERGASTATIKNEVS